MKRSLLTLAVLLSMASAGQAQKLIPDTQKYAAQELKATYNPSDASFIAPLERVFGYEADAPRESKTDITRKAMLPKHAAAAEVDTVQYFTVAQSYHIGYTFNYDGGDVFCYNIGLALDGTKATLTNLFDMEASSRDSYYQSFDTPVEGVYDADAKTITIYTGAAGIKCGNYMGDFYEAFLTAGDVTESGTFNPVEELVFDVTTYADGSIATLTSRSAMRASYTYGNIRIYKSFTANLPEADRSNLTSFISSIDFGENFVNAESTKSIVLINNGGKDADFVIELEAEDDAFTTPELAGVVPAMGTYTLDFTFKAANAGSYEGIATVIYDNGEDEAYVVVDMAGAAKDYPDYSPIVKSGEFEMITGFEYPFEISALEDGTPIATSTNYGRYGSSWLEASFTVPEGKLATVAWKGMSYNVSYWYYNAAGYFVDTLNGAIKSYNGAEDNISDSYEFAPGEHFIRFQYESNYYSGLVENYMYIYDLEYTETTLNADSAILVTPVVNLGNKMLQVGGEAVLNGTATLTNKGANDLRILSITSDNEEFSGNTSVDPVASMKNLSFEVTMVATTAGEKEANLTVETSAGTFNVLVKATVMEMPDFASLVTEGAEYITSWTTNESYPFIIVDGKARNANAGDNSVSPYPQANFGMNLTIPEGKLAYVSWDGHMWGRPVVDGSYDHYYSSYALFEMSHPMNSGSKQAYGSDADASSDIIASDEFWADHLACIPGDHSYKWYWYHNGDGTVPEGDYVEISNIKIHVIDFEPDAAELLTPEVTFESTYVGVNRYKTATVTLHNLGSNDLTIGEIDADEPFYGLETTEVARFNKNVKVTLWFYPSESGDFDGTVTIHTSAGDFDVVCHGTALDAEAERLLMIGDFEDDAQGWTIADRDMDGETWNLGSNLWGNMPSYCHSGSQCLASVSFSNYLGAIEPDNWTFSHYVTIPEQGADLSYYIAAFSPSRFEEHYSLYVVEDISDLDAVAASEPLFSETLEAENGAMDGWSLREFSLDEYAGKTVVLCFRHHDCNGQYIIRLDDVFVTAKPEIVGISTLTDSAASTQIFTVDGRRSERLSQGINIVRSTDANGQAVSKKLIK